MHQSGNKMGEKELIGLLDKFKGIRPFNESQPNSNYHHMQILATTGEATNTKSFLTSLFSVYSHYCMHAHAHEQ